MPQLLPFRGIRYDRLEDLSAVVAPPYDVVDDGERIELEARHPANAVRLILPSGGPERYEAAASRLAAWRSDGTLTVDPVPRLYRYRMTYDVEGRGATTDGVIGALVLEGTDAPPDVLPHERTLPKARSDRLELLRATRANLDPIWLLSLAQGFAAALGPTGRRLGVATDDDGTRHELFDCPSDASDRVLAAFATAPALVADGHHRYETARTYAAEHPDDPGAGAVMAFVVELAEPQLHVQAIHRLLHDADLTALRRDLATVAVLGRVAPNTPAGVAALETAMRERRGLGLVERDTLTVVVPDAAGAVRLQELPGGLADVDAARFDALVRPYLGAATLSYRHDATAVATLVRDGAAAGAVLLGAVGIDTIRAVAAAGGRMPEKTTFFAPKPRTGMVLRSLDP